MPIVGGGGIPFKVQNHTAGGGPNVRYHHLPQFDVASGLYLSNEMIMVEAGRNATTYTGWLKMVNGINMSATYGPILPWDGRLMHVVASAYQVGAQFEGNLLIYKNGVLIETMSSLWYWQAGGPPYWAANGGAGHQFSAGDFFSLKVTGIPFPPPFAPDSPMVRSFFFREYV